MMSMLEVTQITTQIEFGALEDDWNALLQDMQNPPIFLTWEWVSTWWRHYGKEGALWILVVRDGAGEILGIAPWMRLRNGFGPFAVRRIAFIGSGIVYPAHLDLLAKPGAEEAVCAAVLHYLEQERGAWDLLELTALAQNSHLRSALATRDGAYRERDPMPCPYTILPDSWETFEKETLSAAMRRNLRYYRRRLERDHPGEVRFEQVVDAEEVSPALDALVRLHQKRWTQQGQHTALSENRFVAFHKELAATLLAHDWLRLCQLKVGDQVIASNYCFRYRGVLYGYQKGFDPDWERHSPGQILQAYLVEQTIQEGTREFDMLHGQAAKAEWAHESRADAQIVFGQNRQSSLWVLGAALIDNAKPIGKQMLPQTFQRAVERLLVAR
jgi:CelD/BcsL family acetyltransferase involved in cellulose biosynthesis